MIVWNRKSKIVVPGMLCPKIGRPFWFPGIVFLIFEGRNNKDTNFRFNSTFTSAINYLFLKGLKVLLHLRIIDRFVDPTVQYF